MRRYILMVIFMLLFICQAAYAHPPSRMRMSYDKPSRTLKITITHAVTNPESHYVKEVVVKIEGDDVLEHRLSEQETDNTQFVQYSIPDVESGDLIRVEVHCSSFGKRMKELTIK